jgi:hypothetical protein
MRVSFSPITTRPQEVFLGPLSLKQQTAFPSQPLDLQDDFEVNPEVKLYFPV